MKKYLEIAVVAAATVAVLTRIETTQKFLLNVK